MFIGTGGQDQSNMKIRHFLCAALAAILILSAPLSARADAFPTHYVGPLDLGPTLLPPPAPEQSIAWKDDIEAVIAAQKDVSEDDVEAIRNEQALRVSLITDILDTDFTLEKFPRTYALLNNVFQDAATITDMDKKFFHTRRPYQADPRVKLLVDPLDSPAYPSGHTSISLVLAEVLGMIYPENLADFRARADEIAMHRVEAGVHYPGDLEGGRMLAMLITGALIKSEEFQADLAAAREERIKK